MKSFAGSLEIDPCVRRQHEAHVLFPGDRARPKRAPQLGEQRAQGGIGGSGKAVWPQRLHEFGTRRRTASMSGQIDEQEPSLAPG